MVDTIDNVQKDHPAVDFTIKDVTYAQKLQPVGCKLPETGNPTLFPENKGRLTPSVAGPLAAITWICMTKFKQSLVTVTACKGWLVEEEHFVPLLK